MPNSNKKISVIFFIIMLIIAAIVFVLVLSRSKSNSNIEEKSVVLAIKTKPTIATEWRWQKIDKQAAQAHAKIDLGTALPFTAESVYNALQAVKLDTDGNIILDHDALISLDETLERIHNRLDSESLSILQDLIRAALPDKAGEQTAQMVADYYQYLEAKQDFSQINEAISDTDNQESLESVENDEVIYAELQALREVHIGYEATNSLFRISDANAQFMFDSMKVARDNSLTPEEKDNRRTEIEARHIEQSINIADWPERYQAFMNDKHHIMAASIDEGEKRKQLKWLLRQHFNNNELKRIEYLGLDQLT